MVLVEGAKEEIANYSYIENKVKETVQPFDENIEVAPYKKACSCIGTIAKEEAQKAAEKACGTMTMLRESFAALVPRINAKAQNEQEARAERDKKWLEHTAEYRRIEKETMEHHPLKNEPDPTCGFYAGEYWNEQVSEGNLPLKKLNQRYEDGSGCGGIGTIMTTYNPLSKWDWYQIGGRWEGALDPEYDPLKDPRNLVRCSLCGGTGKSNGASCPNCLGSGTSRPFKFARHLKGDIKPVSELFDENGGLIFIPYAIVTPIKLSDTDPKSRWNQRGKMSWWGLSTDEMSIEQWGDAASKILKSHIHCTAVLVDMHI